MQTPTLEQALAQRDEARELAQATQRALNVANADRDALRALLDASAERTAHALAILNDGFKAPEVARELVVETLTGAL